MGTSRCEQHKIDPSGYDKTRPTAAKRGYDKRWRRIRTAFIANNPFCVHCEQEGLYTPTEEIDHIVPLSAGGTHNESNLQALCKSCHSKKTAKDKKIWDLGFQVTKNVTKRGKGGQF